MAFADKDGSGHIEKGEFISLMAKIIHQKNQKEEIKKTFRFYDNDDDGKITVKNLQEAADLLDMEDKVTMLSLNKMIEMGDPKNKGYIKLDGFLKVMLDIGLIPDNE